MNRLKALKEAFPKTIPVMTGYIFLGIAYGFYASSKGLSFLYPMIMSIVIFGGSLEFVAVELLVSPFAPLATLIVALLLQARHVFYGLSMLEKYKKMGWKKFYLVFALTDETFSVNCSAELDNDIDKGWFYFWVTLLDQSYWVIGATLGGLIGGMLNINIIGVDFVMTAMFVVIFMNQWKKDKNHIPGLIGLVVSIFFIFVVGPKNFLIPTMLVIIVLLAILKRPFDKIDKKYNKEDEIHIEGNVINDNTLEQE